MVAQYQVELSFSPDPEILVTSTEHDVLVKPKDGEVIDWKWKIFTQKVEVQSELNLGYFILFHIAGNTDVPRNMYIFNHYVFRWNVLTYDDNRLTDKWLKCQKITDIKRYDFILCDYDFCSKICIFMSMMSCIFMLNISSFIQVSAIRNSLSHMKLMDKLHISNQTLLGYFQDIIDLVDCLQRLHPNHFTSTLVSHIRTQLNDVSMFSYWHQTWVMLIC